MTAPQIHIETSIAAPPERIWRCWTEPDHITCWNFASPDWCCPRVELELRVGGRYQARMEARDGSFGFDFEAVYHVIEPCTEIGYTLSDGRRATTRFTPVGAATRVETLFDPDTEQPIDMQRDGWQAILENFRTYVESTD